MDLRVYYQKIRDWETKIADEFPIVVSNESANGGKEGVKTEVSRQIAAKLIVEGVARLASPAEMEKFRSGIEEAKRVAERIAEAAKLQLTILTPTEFENMKTKPRGAKE